MKNTDERKFNEYDFISLLLPLLCQNGVYEIDENELARELYYYYKDPKFRGLFKDICLVKSSFSDKVDIHNGLYREKFFGGNILWDSLHCETLHLTYPENIDLSLVTKYLSEEELKRINQLAQEIGVRYKVRKKSKTKLNIYGVNPNKTYGLVIGENYGKRIGIELLTDGSVSRINPVQLASNVFFDSPYKDDEYITYDNGRAVFVELENATYAIQRGMSDDRTNFLNLFTEIVDEETLEKISQIGNSAQKDDSHFDQSQPFVKKFILK